MESIKYHPILFSTPMVQAIDEDRKTQTRRIIKYPLKLKDWHISIGEGTEPPPIDFCPYKVGDVFWVRESYHRIHDADTDKFLRFGYKADKNYKGAKWKPSIHMPKRACRFFLKIKSIRAERLQDISEEDSINEGIKRETFTPTGEQCYYFYPCKDLRDDSYLDCPKTSFYSLWQSINGKDSWNKNPFVWVYEFEKIEKPLDFGV